MGHPPDTIGRIQTLLQQVDQATLGIISQVVGMEILIDLVIMPGVVHAFRHNSVVLSPFLNFIDVC